MKLKEAILVLEQHNKWRRGDDNMQMTDPTTLGNAIDIVLKQVKNNQLLPIVNHSCGVDCTELSKDFIEWNNKHNGIADKYLRKWITII